MDAICQPQALFCLSLESELPINHKEMGRVFNPLTQPAVKNLSFDHPIRQRTHLWGFLYRYLSSLESYITDPTLVSFSRSILRLTRTLIVVGFLERGPEEVPRSEVGVDEGSHSAIDLIDQATPRLRGETIREKEKSLSSQVRKWAEPVRNRLMKMCCGQRSLIANQGLTYNTLHAALIETLGMQVRAYFGRHPLLKFLMLRIRNPVAGYEFSLIATLFLCGFKIKLICIPYSCIHLTANLPVCVAQAVNRR